MRKGEEEEEAFEEVKVVYSQEGIPVLHLASQQKYVYVSLNALCLRQ